MVTAVSTIPYNPFLQAGVAPVKLVVSLFMKVVVFLLDYLGEQEWAKSLKLRARKLDCGVVALFEGLWNFGFRFQTVSENAIQNCKGSSYWFIHQYFLGKDPFEVAKGFEHGPPMEAIQMQELPENLRERCIYICETEKGWPIFPKLDPGIYSILIGFTDDMGRPRKGHRVVLLNTAPPMLFDPSMGLAFIEESDWDPFFERKASSLRTSANGHFTVAIFSYYRTCI